MKQTQLEFKSEFLPEVTIVVVFDDDPRYEQVKSYFDEYGYGFMVPDKNLIIVDGEELLNGDDNSILKLTGSLLSRSNLEHSRMSLLPPQCNLKRSAQTSCYSMVTCLPKFTFTHV